MEFHIEKKRTEFRTKNRIECLTLDKKCTLGGHHQMKKKAIGNARQQR